MEKSVIQNFYTNKTILITGGTGFLGTALVEKLLRACSDLNKIILPIRPKSNTTIEERIQEYFNDKIFTKLINDNPEIIHKVIFFPSNLEDRNLGLSYEDHELIKSTTNIIFHSAACTEFSPSLKVAVNSNIKITQNVLNLAKQIKNLQAFIHLSTYFSQCPMENIEEKVIDLTSYKPETLYNLINNFKKDTLKEITPIIIKDWPNVYTMTKNVAECLVETEKDNLPIAIFRPPVVSSVYREPFPGWLNNIQMSTNYGIEIARGLVQVIYSNSEFNSTFVPVDYVVNCMIAIGWFTGTRDKDLKVYNYNSSQNPLSRSKFFNSFANTKYPLENTICRPGYVATKSKYLFELYFLLYQTIPAYLCDTFLRLFGQQPLFVHYMKKIKHMLNSGVHFSITNFKNDFNNVPQLWNTLDVEDKKLFNFDISNIDWDEYMDVFTKGVKKLLNEDFDKMEKCKEQVYLLRCKY